MNQQALAFQAGPWPQDLIDASVLHLRRVFPSVFRCDIVVTEYGGADRKTTVTWGDEKGLPDGGRGLHYVANVGIVPNNELPALAVQHGWTTK